MLSASLLAVSLFGLVGLFSLKIYELKHRVRFFAQTRVCIDAAVDTTLVRVQERFAAAQQVLTPVRVTLVLFSGIAWVISVTVLFLEYARAHIDRMTRYVALHYGDAHTTQSVFLKEIAAHKEAVKRVRRQRRTQVDNSEQVV